MAVWLQVLRVFIVGYFVALFGLAGFVAWSALAAGAANPECAVRDCKRYERVGDWISALSGEALWAASMSFTGVIVLGTLLFALPWAVWGWWVKRRARAPQP